MAKREFAMHLHDRKKPLKNALAAGDFYTAQQLLPAYTQEILALLSTKTTLEQRNQALAEFQDLLSLARVMRAHLSSRLAVVRREVAHLQYQAPAQERHAWRFEA